jgi:hypothetical protein
MKPPIATGVGYIPSALVEESAVEEESGFEDEEGLRNESNVPALDFLRIAGFDSA